LSVTSQSWMSFSLEPGVIRVGLDWVVWLLMGALGGLVTLLSAVAVSNWYRRRHHTTRAAAGRGEAPGEGKGTSEEGSAGAATSSRVRRRGAAIGYLTATVGAEEEEGEAAAAIESTCERAGWELIEIVRDRDTGPTLDRPCLRDALERILNREAQALVVRDLQRLSRSIVDLGALLAWFRDADATLVALDLDLDTSTPEGQHVAATLIALSARDHQRIASGTRRGLAKGRASGRPSGRPAVSQQPELVERITAMRAANMTLTAIAEQLNAEGVPTLRGGKKWRPSSIQAALGYRRPSSRNHLPSQKPRAKPSQVARMRSSDP
jgi:DNA invertase Pin-like site-specific DNA recombinase